MNSEKLQKILARAGLGSRREMERWIEAGRVSLNGECATLGERATLKDKIKVDGKLIKLHSEEQTQTRILLYNKPEGEICTRSDSEGRKLVFDALPDIQNGRWINIGRLDINTSGLLLFTNNGELANRLMHPSTEIEREYAVRVLGKVDPDVIKKLQSGVKLEDGIAKFSQIRAAGGDGANHWYHVVIQEGRNRVVRRLWESQGVKVSRLMRIRFGDVSLPKKLRTSQYMELASSDSGLF